MAYENLWDVPSVDILGDSTENVMEIMKQQAQYLKEGTNGKVMGKFSKIKNVMTSIAGLAAALSPEISDDTEISNLSDRQSCWTRKRGNHLSVRAPVSYCAEGNGR